MAEYISTDPNAGLDGYLSTDPNAGEKPKAKSRLDTYLENQKKVGKALAVDLPAGSARGIAGIGSNIVYLGDKAITGIGNLFSDKAADTGVTGLVTGQKSSDTPEFRNAERKSKIDDFATDRGADPQSLAYKGGKVGAEIAATLPVGGLLARGATAVAPGLARVAPGAVEAVRTAGFSTGRVVAPGALNAAKDLAIRAGGGAVTGGVSAGLIDPEQADTGAAVGAGLPVALSALGSAGRAVGSVIRGPAQSSDMASAVTAARNAGYVIPPTQANPNLLNRVIEGASGKITTAQNASARNAEVTNALAAKAIGLAPDTKITPSVLTNIRSNAGTVYEAVKNTGTVSPGASYIAELDKIAAPYIQAAKGFPNAKASPVLELVESLKSTSFDASAAVEKIKHLRTQADDAFRTGNTDVARAAKSSANALEDVIEAHVKSIGNSQLLDDLREARKLIAKTYSVEKALNPTTGTVDARKLASQLKAGKPLSGGLRDAAEFAGRFPKASQAVEGMGSLPQLSPLDWAASGIASAASGNPLMMAGVLARPGVRALALSPAIQNRLIQGGGTNSMNFLKDPEIQSLIYRSAPAVAANR